MKSQVLTDFLFADFYRTDCTIKYPIPVFSYSYLFSCQSRQFGLIGVAIRQYKEVFLADHDSLAWLMFNDNGF